MSECTSGSRPMLQASATRTAQIETGRSVTRALASLIWVNSPKNPVRAWISRRTSGRKTRGSKFATWSRSAINSGGFPVGQQIPNDCAHRGVEQSASYQNSQDVLNQKLAILEFARKGKIHISDFIEMTISSRRSTKERKIDGLLAELEAGDTLIVSELSRNRKKGAKMGLKTKN